MPATTTAINACDAVIELDNTGGTPINISGSSNKIDMEFTNDIGEFNVFGSKWPIRLSCRKDATFSLDVVYSTAAAEGIAILKEWFFTNSNIRTLKVYLPNNVAGADLYSGEVVMTSLKIPVNADNSDPILVSAELKPTGDWTLTTV